MVILHPHTQLRTIYFPSPLSPAHKAAISRIKGLVHPYGLGISTATSSPSAYYQIPLKGWVDPSTPLSYENKPAEALVVLNSWKNAKSEREFGNLEAMRGVRILEDGTGESLGMMKVTEKWDEELREHGALGWVDEYCGFEMVPFLPIEED